MSEDQDNGWEWLGLYLYRANGTYSGALWAKTLEGFSQMLPRVRRHLKSWREVRITNTGDYLLFHAANGSTEWDEPGAAAGA